MSRVPQIWVVDDDPELRQLLQEYLEREMFVVRTFADGQDIPRRLARERPDLLVLDVMLPREDGLTLCRRLRDQADDIPIIMLTAKNDPIDRVIGMESGADDYVGKPFLPRELSARIHAVLRRRQTLPAATLTAESIVTFGHYRLDMGTRTLSRDGQVVEMTASEFVLLAALTRYPHQPLSRERLLELVRGRDIELSERSMDVQISRLRKLLEANPARPHHIQTVWGFGYVFIPDDPETVRS